jgi:hypothetical protein
MPGMLAAVFTVFCCSALAYARPPAAQTTKASRRTKTGLDVAYHNGQLARRSDRVTAARRALGGLLDTMPHVLRRAIHEAHAIGAAQIGRDGKRPAGINPDGTTNYTHAQLLRKAGVLRRALRRGGIEAAPTQLRVINKLFDHGIVGGAASDHAFEPPPIVDRRSMIEFDDQMPFQERVQHDIVSRLKAGLFPANTGVDHGSLLRSATLQIDYQPVKGTTDHIHVVTEAIGSKLASDARRADYQAAGYKPMIYRRVGSAYVLVFWYDTRKGPPPTPRNRMAEVFSEYDSIGDTY